MLLLFYNFQDWQVFALSPKTKKNLSDHRCTISATHQHFQLHIHGQNFRSRPNYCTFSNCIVRFASMKPISVYLRIKWLGIKFISNLKLFKKKNTKKKTSYNTYIDCHDFRINYSNHILEF